MRGGVDVAGQIGPHLTEAAIDLSAEIRGWENDPQLAVAIASEARRVPAPRQLGGCGGKPVDTSIRRVRIVHAGRQCASGNLHEFVDQEEKVLLGRPLFPDAPAATRIGTNLFFGRTARNRSNGLPGENEFAGGSLQPEHDVMLASDINEHVFVDQLKIAVRVRADRCDWRAEQGLRCLLKPLAPIFVVDGSMFGARRGLGGNGFDELPSDPRGHGIDVNTLGHMMDEVDQHRDRTERQDHGYQHGELGHEVGIAGVDGSKDDHRISERSDEGAERDLIAAIAHEVGEDARAVLIGGEADCHDGDGKYDAGDGDHRARDRREDFAGPLGLGLLIPA